jgi:hypothetical protein
MRRTHLETLIVVLLLIPLSIVMFWYSGQRIQELARQVQSARHSSVPGTIIHSRVFTQKGSKGAISHHFVVQYVYEVDGRRYAGKRVRHLMDNDSQERATALLERFPVQAQVPVFYRPDDPSDALLLPGVRGADLLSLMLLGAFQAFALAAGWALVVQRRRATTVVPAFERDGRTHVTLTEVSPAMVGLFTLGGGLILGHISWSRGYTPSVTTALGLWAAALGLGVAVTLGLRMLLRSGRFDLILDERTGRLSMPATFGREQRLHVPCGQVVAVVQDDIPGNKRRLYRLTLELSTPRAGLRREVIAHWESQARAQALRQWLEERLKLEERPSRAQQPA